MKEPNHRKYDKQNSRKVFETGFTVVSCFERIITYSMRRTRLKINGEALLPILPYYAQIIL